VRNRGLAYKGGTMRAWGIYDELTQRPIRFRRSIIYLKARLAWRKGWERGCAGVKGGKGFEKLAYQTVNRARQRRISVKQLRANQSLIAERERVLCTLLSVPFPGEALTRCPTMDEMIVCVAVIEGWRRNLKNG
jgi:hypothetical protein